ncbi:hypothetical protein [Streptomyces sp. SID3212]|uniref:hypothetical protein n=1 Tax=Streptomyces sp. SID3212 TaxID=2690259 RepID=UPI00136FA932|nr:hypothetical protein [Streptomyces sp. SID3212]MYV56472.1 hypothetical protein [Streptomyces sp. SID3212]
MAAAMNRAPVADAIAADIAAQALAAFDGRITREEADRFAHEAVESLRRDGWHIAAQRECATDDCTRQASQWRTICETCRTHLRRTGDPAKARAEPDWTAVESAARERRPLPGMTPQERRLAGVRMTGLGLSEAEIADIFAVKPRTVRRWRAQERDATAQEQ